MTDPADPTKKPETYASTVSQTSNEDIAKGLKLLNKTLETEKAIKDSVQARIELIKNSLNSEQKLKDILKDQATTLDEINKQYILVYENKKSIIDSSQILDEIEQKKFEALKQEFKINQETYILLLKEIEEKKKAGQLDTQEAKNLEKRKKEYEEILKIQGRQIQLEQLKQKVVENISSITNQTLQTLIEQVNVLDQHIVNVSKLNGAYGDNLAKLREANIQIYQATAGTGIMAAEANEAFSELSKNFIGLTAQSQQNIIKMSTGIAELAKIGVNAASAAKGMDSLVNAMGKTSEQAYKMQESFSQMAIKNRLALGSVNQAFADNSSRFVGYGEQMTKVLAGLAEQSLKTGVAMNGLVKIAQQFDTFESAARAVGNLNALLGGDYLNSIELLTASDDERIKLLKDSVAASGIQWESMNRFQKMAIANAAGISDLNEAAKIFGQTSLQNTREQEEAAKVQKTLAEQAQSVSTIMQKMQSVFNGLIIAADPLVSLLSWIADGFSTVIKFFTELGGGIGTTGGKIGTVVGSLIVLWGVWTAKNLLLTGSFGNVFKSLGGLIKRFLAYRAAKKAALAADAVPTTPLANITKIPPGSGPIASATQVIPPATPAVAGGPSPISGVNQTTNVANKTAASSGNIIKAAGALLLFAGALLLLGKALNEFKQFVQGEGQGGAIGVMIGAIAGLILVAKLLEGSKVSVGQGILVLLAMSIAVAAIGLALNLFTKLDWKILAGVGAIILGLGLAIAGLGMVFSNPLTGTALLFGIGAIIAIGVAVGLLGAGLIKVVESIEKASPAFANLASTLKELFQIKDLDKSFTSLENFLIGLSNIDYSPINNLAIAIGSLAENLQKLASLSSEMSLTVTGNAQTVVDQTLNQAASTVATTAQAISQVSAAKSETLIPAAQTTAFVPVIVQIDKKTIIDILSGDMEVIAEGAVENYFGQVASGVKSASAIQALVSDVLAK